MPVQADRRPSDQEWEDHREVLEELYARSPLGVVMKHMEKKYHFFAKKNQYEKYLTHKWKLHKNIKSEKWKAILPVVCEMERSGKQVELWINGNKKSELAIRKATRRYASRGSPLQTPDSIGRYPGGVNVQEAPSITVPLVTFELPFHELESCLQKDAWISSTQGGHNEHPKLLETNLRASEASGLARYAEEALAPVLPLECNLARSTTIQLDKRLFSTPLHRKVLFSVANNFAGVGNISRENAARLLECHAGEVVYQIVQGASQYYAAQSIALGVFRVAIERGNCALVISLLRHALLGFDLNQTIFPFGHYLYTPIELAAQFLRTDVVLALFGEGADPSLTDSRRSSWSEGGAVHIALSNSFQNCMVLELTERLLNIGTELNAMQMSRIIDRDQEGKLVLRLISMYAAKCHQHWSEYGIFQKVFQIHSHDLCLDVLKIMLEHGADLNHCCSSASPKTIIDTTAKRGDLIMMDHLLDAGALMTDESLTHAISSGNLLLVRRMLDLDATSNHVVDENVYPLAAAIWSGNPHIIDLVISHQGLTSLNEPEFFRLAFSAIAQVREPKWLFDHLIKMSGALRPEDASFALAIAAAENMSEVALDLVDAGADLNVTDGLSVWPPLMSALAHEDAILVRTLLAAGVDPNAGVLEKTEHGNTTLYISPLYMAIKWGNIEIVRDVLQAGAEVSPGSAKQRGTIEAAPLNLAIECENTIAVDLLLREGCDINNPNCRISGNTALRTAVITGQLDIATHVLSLGADPHDTWALEAAAEHGLKFLDLLLQSHADRYPRGRKRWGGLALKIAIEKHNYELFKRAVEIYGADANQFLETDEFGRKVVTSFGHAILESKRIGIRYVELLLQNLDKTNCNPDVVVSKVQAYHNEPRSQVTGLIAAIETGYLPIVELLLRHGANVNFPAFGGFKRTPLQRASELGNLRIIQLLIKYGADVNAPASRRGGGTALQLAATQGFIGVVEFLLNHKADIYAPCSEVEGRSPLEGAAEHGRLDMISVLLQAGAGHEGEDAIQFTRAIDLAKSNGQIVTTRMLERYIQFRTLSSPQPFEEMMDWDPKD